MYILCVLVFFFFKQKTAYEMRISDWSSDVCSSDLERTTAARLAGGATVIGHKIGLTSKAVQDQLGVDRPDFGILFDDMGYAESDVVPMERLLDRKSVV